MDQDRRFGSAHITTVENLSAGELQEFVEKVAGCVEGENFHVTVGVTESVPEKDNGEEMILHDIRTAEGALRNIDNEDIDRNDLMSIYSMIEDLDDWEMAFRSGKLPRQRCPMCDEKKPKERVRICQDDEIRCKECREIDEVEVNFQEEAKDDPN